MVECTLTRLEEGPFYILHSKTEEISLVLTDPRGFIEGYQIQIPVQDLEDIGVNSEQDAVVLLVTILGDTPSDFCVNLMAPVVINQRNGTGKQVILSNSGYPSRYPLFSKSLFGAGGSYAGIG